MKWTHAVPQIKTTDNILLMILKKMGLFPNFQTDLFSDKIFCRYLTCVQKLVLFEQKNVNSSEKLLSSLIEKRF